MEWNIYVSLPGLQKRSKTSSTRIWAAEHILAICVLDGTKLVTLSTPSLTVSYIWHNDVRDDFHLPVGIFGGG